jgi:hypothetical protein
MLMAPENGKPNYIPTPRACQPKHPRRFDNPRAPRYLGRMDMDRVHAPGVSATLPPHRALLPRPAGSGAA